MKKQEQHPVLPSTTTTPETPNNTKAIERPSSFFYFRRHRLPTPTPSTDTVYRHRNYTEAATQHLQSSPYVSQGLITAVISHKGNFPPSASLTSHSGIGVIMSNEGYFDHWLSSQHTVEWDSSCLTRATYTDRNLQRLFSIINFRHRKQWCSVARCVIRGYLL